MPTFAILAGEGLRRDDLKAIVDEAFSPATGTPAFSLCFSLPEDEKDPTLKRLQDEKVQVVLVDIPAENSGPALGVIELLHAELAAIPVFAIGDIGDANIVVTAMRNGATEFLPHQFAPADLAEAIARLHQSSKAVGFERAGRIITVVNAKGGCGATTVAVNIAVSLQKEHGKSVLVDLAPLGHAALHLNAQPNFGIATALQNPGRLDQAFLDGLLTQTETGVDLLASTEAGLEIPAGRGGVERLLELLGERYQYVVVDVSSRLDPLVRSLCDISDRVLLVADSETLVLLWSAARVQRYLAAERANFDKLQLVLNRFSKNFPLSDTDAEAATDARVLWKIPTEGAIVGPAVDSGNPVVLKKSSEAGRALKGLADALVELTRSRKRSPAAPPREPTAAPMFSYVMR